jgi:hypothetical protein
MHVPVEASGSLDRMAAVWEQDRQAYDISG